MSKDTKKDCNALPLPLLPSYMEVENMFQQKSPLRGFFTLFWVVMGSYALQTMIFTWRSTGGLLGLNTFSMLTQNVLQLLISDLFMLLTASLCFPLQYLISLNYIRALKTQYVVQFIFEASFLIGFTVWTYTRNWFLIQKSTLILHVMVSLMKMHSYNSMNQKFYASRKVYLEVKTKVSDSKLDTETDALLKSQFSSSSLTCVYPQNLTLSNYFDYLLIPSLVYELEYPRTEKFRLGYFLEKVFALFGCIILFYVAIEHYLIPIYHDSNDFTLIEKVIKLIIPFTVIHLLVFYILFEVVCNGFAELSRYADRNFYDDWWNSHNFLEYSSKWNKPVYKFLRVHVFLSLVETFKMKKRTALMLTFLISAIAHEIVMTVSSKRLNMIFFIFQMAQIPLISFMQLKIVVDRPWLGNAVVWVGLCSGLPILSLFYGGIL